ncbi:MAG: hypothetical protein JXQ87_14865 [Bacteroidia bacterium]
MKNLIWLFFLIQLILTSCSGIYIKSTVNVPTVDTTNRHEMKVGGSIGCGDLQNNFLIKKKVVLAHSLSFNNYDVFPENFQNATSNFKTEMGFGPYIKSPFLASIGYGRRFGPTTQKGPLFAGELESYKASVPNFYTFSIQKSILLSSVADKLLKHFIGTNDNLKPKFTLHGRTFFTIKAESVFVPYMEINGWYKENYRDVQLDLNFNQYVRIYKGMGFQGTYGIKVFLNEYLNDRYFGGHRFTNELFYVRLHLVF